MKLAQMSITGIRITDMMQQVEQTSGLVRTAAIERFEHLIDVSLNAGTIDQAQHQRAMQWLAAI